MCVTTPSAALENANAQVDSAVLCVMSVKLITGVLLALLALTVDYTVHVTARSLAMDSVNAKASSPERFATLVCQILLVPLVHLAHFAFMEHAWMGSLVVANVLAQPDSMALCVKFAMPIIGVLLAWLVLLVIMVPATTPCWAMDCVCVNRDLQEARVISVRPATLVPRVRVVLHASTVLATMGSRVTANALARTTSMGHSAMIAQPITGVLPVYPAVHAVAMVPVTVRLLATVSVIVMKISTAHNALVALPIILDRHVPLAPPVDLMAHVTLGKLEMDNALVRETSVGPCAINARLDSTACHA